MSTGDLTGGRTGGVLECLVPDFSRRPSYCVALWIQGDITEADAVSTLRAMPLAKRCRVPSVHLGRARARTKPDNPISRHISIYIMLHPVCFLTVFIGHNGTPRRGQHRRRPQRAGEEGSNARAKKAPTQRDTARRATPKKAPTCGRRRPQGAGEEGNTEEGKYEDEAKKYEVWRCPSLPPQDARWFDLCPRGLSNRLVTLGGMG